MRVQNNLKRIISIMIFITPLFADNSNDVKIEMRVNGHSHFLDNDINTGIAEFWQSNKDSIERDIEVKDDVQSINFPDIPDIKYFPNSTDNKKVTVEIDFERIEVDIKLNSLKWWESVAAWSLCPFSGGNFEIDMSFSYDYVIGVDTSGVYLQQIGTLTTDVKDIDCGAGIEILLGSLEDEIKSAIESNMPGFLPLKVTLIPINKFAESGYGIVGGVNPVQEIQDLMDSFPIDISIGTIVYDNEKIFIFNLSLMPGYGSNLTLYESGTPQLPQDPVLDLSGITMNGDKYQHFPGSAGSWQNEISGLHDIIQNELGLTHVRVEAIWKYVCPILPSIVKSEIEDYPNITSQTIINFNTYIANINQIHPQLPGGISPQKTGWQWLDIVMNDLDAKNLTPLLIVGQGLSTSVPYAENTSGEYKIIAPGVPRGTDSTDFIGITEEMYLYWLEVYTRAVVQKYAGKVQYWEAEDELNAARYTESFDWWRQGSAWHDDTLGGFLDQVASTLYSTITQFDPDAEVVHAFHMFEMARCLDQWSAYYDIAGINFYPNELNAYPVFGFFGR